MSASRTIIETSERQDAADPPVLELRSIGDGRAFYRALASIIVRRELKAAGVIPDLDACNVMPPDDNER